jgi:hypothetical protein
MGRDEVRKILTEALESLYEDRIRPAGLYVRGRLKERGGQQGMLTNYLELYARFPDVFSISKQADESTIEFITPPAWFKGYVNIDDPADAYEETMWQQLEEYLKTGHQFAGGRYGMAKELQSRKLAFFSKYCLGEICNIVQLAIQKHKLIVYHKKMLKTLDHATNGIEGTKKNANGEFRCISDARELCLILCRMCMRRRNVPLRLEQLRNMMNKEHSLTVNEMALQCTKLSEVMKLEPMRTAFVLTSDGGSMKLSLGDPAHFPESVREIHAEALAAEQKWEGEQRRSRSRSPIRP